MARNKNINRLITDNAKVLQKENIALKERIKELESLVKESDSLPCVSEWVAVDERLPEHGEQVLTFTPDSEATYQLQRIITFGSMQSGFPSGVTHWRPLPEPPCR